MTNDEINSEIGKAAIERKQCLDRISCYQERMKKAAQGIQYLLDDEKNPLLEDNQFFLNHPTDPRSDAKGYIEVLKREGELYAFLKKHNAI